jgi:hypothetical protein
MNERIEELINKIWAKEYWDHPNTDKLLLAQLNRFAELLIKDCGVALNPMWQTPISRRQAHQLIKEHFGVKQ